MKARYVFEQYPDAQWLAIDKDKCVFLSAVEPVIGKDEWYLKDKFWFINLYVISIDEFANKPWQKCKISRDEAMQDDYCEWKPDKFDGEVHCYTGCGKEYLFSEQEEQNEYKYCPYCGKKIKEVTV